MARWDSDDAPSSTSSTPAQDRSEPTERDSAPQVRQLPDQIPIRTFDRNRDARQHHLTLPSGAPREAVRHGNRTYHLRGSEVDLLERAARFRSVFTGDLDRDAGDHRRFSEDLRSLERQGLVEERTLTRLRDSRVADVVAVTSQGKSLLDHHRDPEHDRGQTYYRGWVKPAEVWHDASLFRMAREVETEIERDGGRVRRVILDDELKARAYRALHDNRARSDAVESVAAAHGLHVENGRFVLPDVRLEVEEPDGSVRTVDLELVTEHYHRGHIGGKAKAGFRMFRGGSSTGRGGTPRDEHLMKKLLAMNRDIERSRALEQFGYTPRQARFLLFVALHGGYFLRRQYVAFTGCAHGQAAVRLITTTTARAHVRALPYGRQGHVFHLCARPVYAAIGQEHNRNRRPAEWSAVIRKLMTLDFVLAHCVARFWATEEDKIALLRELGLRPDIWPAKRYAPRRPGGPMTTRYFVDKMPWFRLPADERLWFTSVDGECTLKGFDTFLLQYRNLLAATPSGVIYVGTGTWPGPVEQVFRTRFVQPFGPRSLSELAFIDYCRLRREVEAGRFANLTINDLGRFRDARPKFASSVFDELYARWLRDGDGAVSSDHVSAREATTAPALSVHRLPFTYGQGPSHRSVPDGKRG